MIQKTIGIVGGGQLGRMLTLSAHNLGCKVIVVDPVDNCPAQQVGAEQIKAPITDANAIKKLSESCDVITIEVEHVDVATLELLAKNGYNVSPSPSTIKLIKDKLLQKEFLQSKKIPVAPFVKINSKQDAQKALKQFNGKMIIKTRMGGFDGRGNMLIDSPRKINIAFDKFKDAELYAEKYIKFDKELAVIVARTNKDKFVFYPVVETVHKRNICLEVYAPANVESKVVKKAQNIAKKVAKNLQGAGVFAIEMFLTSGGSIVVNEIAPRVHNSGHLTIDANKTSQFEQHIRAILDLPLGETKLLTPSAVMVNILGERNGPTQVSGLDKALDIPEVSVHLYGKTPTKVDRKMGHITATGDSFNQAKKRAKKARSKISV